VIGTIHLNRYKIESELGKGGMGTVYKAHDTLLHRAVAIKFLNTDGIGTEGRSRLIQEARAVAQLNHPNIVSVFDAGETEGNPFIVMEFVPGNTLKGIATPSISEVLVMAGQICKALDHAHSKGIIHRDLKLENIIVTDSQILKLMDFGLARSSDDSRMTEEGVLKGTLAYIAPELIQGEPASTQSDLYAFGVILYELLTGHTPFQGTMTVVLSQHLNGVVTPPSKHNVDIPAWVDDLVLRLLAKHPEERPASAKDAQIMIEERSTASVAGQRLPTGTVTFLFTDIEGSTKLAREHPETWEDTRARHHAILQTAMDAHHGHVFQIIGDAFCVAFHTADDGLLAAIDAQQKLQNENWGETLLKVRMGLHTGQAEINGREYHGYLAMSLVQRVMSAGYGGQILLSDATENLLRGQLPKEISLRDLGENRLKDVPQLVRIFQAFVPNLPADFPKLSTLNLAPNNLPTNLSKFIGREKEIAEVKGALSEYRLVTLTGSGGVGKTRLSLQVATELLDQFPNGTWFVELAPITDPDLIPQIILTAADMQAQQGRSALESLTDFLREKTSLLVLDNCEHLIEACAKLADTLLNAAPNLKILASSREALGVKGEQAWHVPSLSIPDLKHLPAVEGLSQYEAVRLFIDRAVLAQPHFTVTDENANAVAQICSRLDGIPLAIELAAARVKVLKAEQIAERLNDRFRLLTGGSRTALPRQQTLRALIDWSYDLLAENEKLLLRRLAVFMGGCMLEAAEQVCSDGQLHAEDVLDLIIHLVDKSLVVVDEQPGQLRYRMLETVRQYAREKLLESGEGERFRIQHLAYFLKFAEETEPHLSRAEQIEWLDRLELDDDNLRAALEWAVDDPQNDPPEAALRLCNALWYFWYLRGNRLGRREWFSRALTIPTQSLRTIARARALGIAGFFALQQYDQEEAATLLEESIILCRELNNKPGLAFAIFRKAVYLSFASKDLSVVRSLYEESLNLYRQIDDRWSISWVLYGLGELALFNAYDHPAAHQYLKESLKLSREAGDRHRISFTLQRLGTLAVNQGNLSAAWECFYESLILGRELNDKEGMETSLFSLVNVAYGQGNYQQAEQLLEEMIAIARDLGDKEEFAFIQFLLGRVARYQTNYKEAIKWHTESLTYLQKINNKNTVAWIVLGLGELARLENDYVAAHSYLLEALSGAKEIDEREIIIWVLEEFAALGAAQGQAKRSAALFGAAETLRAMIQVVLFPVERAEVDKNIAATRAQMSEDEFNQAWTEGKAMTMEEAIKFALEES
jgi:predicted ATPase/serine/threonine protein kinase